MAGEGWGAPSDKEKVGGTLEAVVKQGPRSSCLGGQAEVTLQFLFKSQKGKGAVRGPEPEVEVSIS